MAHLTGWPVLEAARCRAPALPWRRRLARYGGVSLVTAGLAQGGLALGYGALRWSTTSAVVLSLLVSVGPAYWLNRRYVWRERSTKSRQIMPSAVLAVAGSAVAAVTTYGAEHLARCHL